MIRIFFIILTLIVISPSLKINAQSKVPILIYHSIEEFAGIGSKELYVTPSNFEKQIEYLKNNGYTLLTFEQWAEINKVKKPIFITIDDGYKNNLNALHIFQKLADPRFKPRATLFVISDFIGRPNRLTRKEIKQMADSTFFSIQSHTSTHPDLTKTTNYAFELKESKEKIESITKKLVLALAYPYGNFDQKVVKETKKYYQFGLTTTPGPFVSTGQLNERFLLPRIYIKNSTTIDQFAKLVIE